MDEYLDDVGKGITTLPLSDEVPSTMKLQADFLHELKNYFRNLNTQIGSFPYYFMVIAIIVLVASLVLFVLKTFLDQLFYLKKYSGTTKVIYTWTNTVHRAGEIFTANISPVSSGASGQDEVLGAADKQKLLSYLTIIVKYNDETIKHFTSFDADQKIIAMTLKQAGEYSIYSSYVIFRFFDFNINGSPYKKTVSSGSIDASQTEFNGQDSYDVITVSSGIRYHFSIIPKDRYKNVCSRESVDYRLFTFKYRQLDAVKREGTGRENAITATNTIKHSFDTNSYGEFCLILAIPFGSYWEGKVYYDRQLIIGGEFDIISITHEEENLLTKFVNEDIGIKEPQFEGFAEIIGPQFTRRYYDIFIGLSPTKLQLFNVDTTGKKNKFSTYKVSSRTNILFHRVKEWNGQLLYCLEISDDINDQFPFYINHSQGRSLLSLYFHYKAQYDNNRFQFPFRTKRNIFFQELGLRLSETKITLHKHYIRISSDPDRIVQNTYEQIRRMSKQDWREEFCIVFEGQPLNGEQDLVKWFTLLMDAIFTERLSGPPGMFSKYSTSAYLHPNPVHYRDNFKWKPELYHLAGRILGKYLVELLYDRLKTPVFKASLSRSLLSRLIGFVPTHEQVRVDHPQVYEKRFLPVLKAIDVSTLDRNFSEEFDCLGNYLHKPIELIPSGSNIKVTKENRERYLNCLAKYYMATIANEEIHNIRTGFYTLVPEETLTILDAEDLENILKHGKTSKNENGSCAWSWIPGFNCKTQPIESNVKARAPWDSCRAERKCFTPSNVENTSKNSKNDTSPPKFHNNIHDRFKLPRNDINSQSTMDELTRGVNSIQISKSNYRESGNSRERRFAPQPSASINERSYLHGLW